MKEIGLRSMLRRKRETNRRKRIYSNLTVPTDNNSTSEKKVIADTLKTLEKMRENN